MQLLDPTPVLVFLLAVLGVAAVALALVVAALPGALRTTRRDRLTRHETIPTYYGRLHFAH